MKAFSVILTILMNSVVFAQQTVDFIFKLDNNNEHLKIEQLRYYVSSIELRQGNSTVYVESSSYHLIDHSDPSMTKITLTIPNEITYDAVNFNIGVDSAKNMQGVHGGDLDPTKGMYWTWQSGYINFKLEGHYHENELSYHIGGFMYPNNACRNVQLYIKNLEGNYVIRVSPEKILEQVDYQKVNHVMSPGKSANFIADILPRIFYVE